MVSYLSAIITFRMSIIRVVVVIHRYEDPIVSAVTIAVKVLIGSDIVVFIVVRDVVDRIVRGMEVSIHREIRITQEISVVPPFVTIRRVESFAVLRVLDVVMLGIYFLSVRYTSCKHLMGDRRNLVLIGVAILVHSSVIIVNQRRSRIGRLVRNGLVYVVLSARREDNVILVCIPAYGKAYEEVPLSIQTGEIIIVVDRS